MMYWQTIASPNDEFRLVKMGNMLWLETDHPSEQIDNPAWLKELYINLSDGSLSNDHVQHFADFLRRCGVNDGTSQLLMATAIFTKANEMGWFDEH